jgi:hypothetical protein
MFSSVHSSLDKENSIKIYMSWAAFSENPQMQRVLIQLKAIKIYPSVEKTILFDFFVKTSFLGSSKHAQVHWEYFANSDIVYSRWTLPLNV